MAYRSIPSRTDFDECFFSQARAEATRGSAIEASEPDDEAERRKHQVLLASPVVLADVVDLLDFRADRVDLAEVPGEPGAEDQVRGVASAVAESGDFSVHPLHGLHLHAGEQQAGPAEYLELVVEGQDADRGEHRSPDGGLEL